EGAHRLGARAVASVHAERKPDDEALAMLALDGLPEAFDILREFRPSDRFRRPSEMPPCVADRDPDRLRPHVQPQKLAAIRKSGCELRGRSSDQRHAASLRSASRRIALQKSA